MQVGGERDTFDPDGMVQFQHDRKLELHGSGWVSGRAPVRHRRRHAGHPRSRHQSLDLNLTRSLADVDAEKR